MARHISLVDWEMRSDRNGDVYEANIKASLVDWEMRSDRNNRSTSCVAADSLVD